MITIPLSLLIERDVQIGAAEAVAIVQALTSSAGLPAVSNIEIDSEGGVRNRSSQGEPTVAALAAVLDQLLPPTGIPASLRFTIARGRGVVEAPAFESVEEFSQAIARFEAGERSQMIRGLLARARPARPAPSTPAAVVSTPKLEPSPVPRVIQRTTAPLPPPRLPRRRFAPLLFGGAALALSALGGYAIVDFARAQHRLAPAADADVRPANAPEESTDATTAPAAPSVAIPRSTAAGKREGAVPAIAGAFSPAFSPNGTALFFQTGGSKDPTSAIATTAPDSGLSDDLRIMKIVDDGSRNYHAQPSPDGQFVAFDSDRAGVRAVYVADRDGSNVRRLSGEGYAALPTWSPDGTRLAFVRAEANRPSVWNLWMQPLAGGPAERITEYRYGQTWAASWFPDGRRIAYSHETDLTILDFTNGRMTVVASPVPGRLVRTPAVSPDGSRIVFQVFRAGAWMLNVADGSMTCVLADPTAEEFAWAPDGRRFAFHSRQDGRWGVFVFTAPARS